MNNRGGLNLGDEIRNIVQDAVNNRDFNRLNRDVRNVVNGALDEVRRSIAGKHSNHQTWNNQSWNNQSWNNQSWKFDDYQYSHDRYSETWNFNNDHRGYKKNKPASKSDKITVPVERFQAYCLLYLVQSEVLCF